MLMQNFDKNTNMTVLIKISTSALENSSQMLNIYLTLVMQDQIEF